MAFKLTKTKVDNIPNPESGQVFYRDTELKGFGLRVGKSTKAYYAEKRVNGKTVRVTIGTHGQITTEQARKEAQKLLGIMTTGHNPTDEKKQSKAKAITLGEAFAEYLNARKSLNPRTIYDYKGVMRNCFKDWQDKALADISKDMIATRHAKIGENSGAAKANLSMRVLSTVFNFAIARYEDSKGTPIISDNPVKRLSQTRAWYRVDRRNTLIKPHELPALFEGLKQLTDIDITKTAEVVRDYILLILFTGLRRQEAAKLKWEQVDFKAKTLTVTDTKNSEPLTLPLSDYLCDLLKVRYENRVNDYVFPGNSEAGYLTEPKRKKTKVIELSGVSFTIHDLRRTFITIAESLDISSYAVKVKVLEQLHFFLQ
jgi:integrase